MSIVSILYIIAIIASWSPAALMVYFAIKQKRLKFSPLKIRPADIFRSFFVSWKKAHWGIKASIIVFAVIGYALVALVWVDERHISLYLAALFVIIVIYLTFIDLMWLLLDIARNDLGKLKAYLIFGDVFTIISLFLAAINYFQNKTALAALFAGLAVIGVIISKIWAAVLLPLLLNNLPVSVRDILLSRYIGKWLDARKRKKQATPPTPIATSKGEEKKASQAPEREIERELL